MHPYFILLLIFISCDRPAENHRTKHNLTETQSYSSDLPAAETQLPPDFQPDNIAYHFDFPVGKPDAEGYYDAQSFGTNHHLGEDWNGTGGGNTDLGDPIYAIGTGYVRSAGDVGLGWGNVIRVIHVLPDSTVVESLYAHCDTLWVTPDMWVRRGQRIGSIGTANGNYLAHLHLEIRNDTTLTVGGGYDTDIDGYLDPTLFIQSHR